jgi:zinc/manganese transport system ATP-binding protein
VSTPPGLPELFAYLAGRRNVVMWRLDVVASCLHGERWGIPALMQADRRMIEDTLAAVGARNLADRPLSEMSGGERQRLLLAQGLIN